MTTDEMIKELRLESDDSFHPRKLRQFFKRVANRLEELQQEVNAQEEIRTQHDD